MKFPLQKGSSQKGLGVKPGQCPICKKSGIGEPGSFAWLNAGALLDIGNGTAMIDEKIKAFFTIGFHGAHDNEKDEASASLEIVRDPSIGQFEFYFCSTSCLRQFFNVCVDELESRLEISKKRP